MNSIQSLTNTVVNTMERHENINREMALNAARHENITREILNHVHENSYPLHGTDELARSVID
jgi:hypothetical protein